MPAYLIANVIVEDAKKFADYLVETPPILEKYSGRYLARGGDIEYVEGEWKPDRIVIVEFDSMEKAQAFIQSDEYKPLRLLRQATTRTDMIFVDGMEF